MKYYQSFLKKKPAQLAACLTMDVQVTHALYVVAHVKSVLQGVQDVHLAQAVVLQVVLVAA